MGKKAVKQSAKARKNKTPTRRTTGIPDDGIPDRDAAEAVWNTTMAVEVPSAGTIAAYLTQRGLTHRPPDAPSAAHVTSVLRVEGGDKYVVGKTIAEGGMGIVKEVSDVN